MSSLYPPPLTRSSLIGYRQPSSVTLRTIAPDRTTNESVWRNRYAAQCRQEVMSPPSEYRRCSPPSSERIKCRKPSTIRRVYVDQQTGEMRVTSSGRRVEQPLDGAGEMDIYRKSLERPRRCRVRSDTAPPRASRPFWDQSLQTKSVIMKSRASLNSPASTSQCPPSVPTSIVRKLLPRRSRSAESSTSAFEIPTRYPRGQQRPTGLASGHHALLLRHQEIVEASRKLPSVTKWRPHRTLFEPFDRAQRLTLPLPHNYNRYLTLTTPYDVTTTRRCGQDATLRREASKKCEDWFNTWLE